MMRRYPKKMYSQEQKDWCVQYQNLTDFEPVMDEYESGKASFYEAAKWNVHWYEDHTSDMHLKIQRGIPGAREHFDKELQEAEK